MRLDPTDLEFRALFDLAGYVDYVGGAARSTDDEIQLVRHAGNWIGEGVLGSLAHIIAQKASEIDPRVARAMQEP